MHEHGGKVGDDERLADEPLSPVVLRLVEVEERNDELLKLNRSIRLGVDELEIEGNLIPSFRSIRSLEGCERLTSLSGAENVCSVFSVELWAHHGMQRM